MKLTTLTLASAAVALLGGTAFAQPQPAGPTPGSVTGDWNGAHAPPDDKQYKSKVIVPTAELPASVASTTAAEPAAETPAAASASADVSANAPSFTNITVTNGPVPDTAENRAKYGQPLSATGRRTAARGN